MLVRKEKWWRKSLWLGGQGLPRGGGYPGRVTGGDGGNSDRMPAGIYTIVESGLKYSNKTSNKAGKPL